tara:strand:+ start:370 stop:630 length:261 start_codon:yes stop_codon:yes gene_type:complete
MLVVAAVDVQTNHQIPQEKVVKVVVEMEQEAHPQRHGLVVVEVLTLVVVEAVEPYNHLIQILLVDSLVVLVVLVLLLLDIELINAY